ncbi:MAG: phytoene/squalene synthase family protein [Candidatus Thermoplasmatota archaeon]|nr:phytoene/squalene synthase family protein [Candidatus Thermoplasmatota archaeon]
MPDRTIYKIFKKGSKTYFYNSIFFPKKIKEDVFILYSFVRKADNYVDSVPQQGKEFYDFIGRFQKAMGGQETGDVVVDSFAELCFRKDFDPNWTKSFLRSMEMDLTKSSYANMDEVDEYIYGSAEVIGLYMSQIIGLKPEAHIHARYLGKAMQYINFIRDINEDLTLGRTYFPRHDFEKYGLDNLTPEEARMKPEAHASFVRAQIARYDQWQEKAEDGFKMIPKRCRIPVKNASEMYKWTANRIRNNPAIVYNQKVKPSIPRIVLTMSVNTISG